MRDAPDFPSIDVMLGCVARVRDAFKRADYQRLLPKPFWLETMTKNVSGAIEYCFRDYEKRQEVLFGPAGVILREGPVFGAPVLIAPVNFLAQPNAMLLFAVDEESTASRYWEGFPRRRRVPPEKQELGVVEPGLASTDHSDSSPNDAP